MPVNPDMKLVENIFKKAKRTRMSAQDIQDEIFRKMPAGKKLKLASDFSMFILKSGFYGFRGINSRNRKNS